MTSSGPNLFLTLNSAFLHTSFMLRVHVMERWLPTDSGLHTPRFKTRIKGDRACFSIVPAKFPRLHLFGSGDMLVPEPISVSGDAVLRPGWSHMPHQEVRGGVRYLIPMGGGREERCSQGKIEIQAKGGWVLGKQLACCSYMTVKFSRTRYPSISLASGPSKVPCL